VDHKPRLPVVRSLSPDTRSENLDRLGERAYDVLVVGGGITGAGIALDAASRGLRVGLVERDDLASGTSSRSSSLIHGGLRYLSTGMMSIVRESAVERERLRRLAPHLVQPLEFVITAPRRLGPALGATLWAYDAMASFRAARPRRVPRTELSELLPGMSARSAGWTFTDCRTDDARLVFEVARTAHRLGADIVTRAEVVELLRAGGRVVGATVRDGVGGSAVDVRARWVVSATGVWADAVRGLAGETAPLLMPSKGTHLVFPRSLVPVKNAVVVPSRTGDHRSAFLIPTGSHVVVGTTDTVYGGALDDPALEPDDAEYLCSAVNHALETDLRPTDATGAWAGLRPLVHPGGRLHADSEALSRRHVILDEPEGLVTITGGKLTTYRRMAEELVDQLVPSLGRGEPSRTTQLPLGLRGPVTAAVAAAAAACTAAGVDPELAVGLVERHGGGRHRGRAPGRRDRRDRSPRPRAGLPCRRGPLGGGARARDVCGRRARPSAPGLAARRGRGRTRRRADRRCTRGDAGLERGAGGRLGGRVPGPRPGRARTGAAQVFRRSALGSSLNSAGV
jgi:glycerol-3-phosphate dehydrogenase